MVCVGGVIWAHQKNRETLIFLAMSKRSEDVHVVFEDRWLKTPTPYHSYNRSVIILCLSHDMASIGGDEEIVGVGIKW